LGSSIPGGELLDHLIVFDLHVLALLVPVDQFLDRRGQILVGADDGKQRADVELALEGEIAADHEIEKGRRLRHHVVDVFHQELALVKLEADLEDAAQAVDDVGALKIGGVVGVDLDGAVDASRRCGRPVGAR
jgi:hypothetical protein